MVFISEVKQRVSFKVPGFEVIEANNVKFSRGGLVMLIKSYLVPNIKNIDKSVNEQIWIELDSLPDVLIGCVALR